MEAGVHSASCPEPTMWLLLGSVSWGFHNCNPIWGLSSEWIDAHPVHSTLWVSGAHNPFLPFVFTLLFVSDGQQWHKATITLFPAGRERSSLQTHPETCQGSQKISYKFFLAQHWTWRNSREEGDVWMVIMTVHLDGLQATCKLIGIASGCVWVCRDDLGKALAWWVV